MNPFDVIIVEDDDLLARVMTVRCRTMGGRIRVAPDAMMALMQVHKSPPDVILLDNGLPAGSGLGILEMLRADVRLADIPVIVYSGTSDEYTIRRCQEMGAHFIRKSPDDWTKLKPLIQQCVLEQRRKRSAA